MKKRSLAVLMAGAMAVTSLTALTAGYTVVMAEKKDGYTIGLAMNTQTNPFFVTVKEGVQKACDERGIELIVTDAQDDPAIQQKDVENLITKKPDAIIIDNPHLKDQEVDAPRIRAAQGYTASLKGSSTDLPSLKFSPLALNHNEPTLSPRFGESKRANGTTTGQEAVPSEAWRER